MTARGTKNGQYVSARGGAPEVAERVRDLLPAKMSDEGTIALLWHMLVFAPRAQNAHVRRQLDPDVRSFYDNGCRHLRAVK